MSSAGAQRLQGASSRGGGRQPRRIRVYDCRSGDKPSSSGPLLETSGLDFNHFLQILHEAMIPNFTLGLGSVFMKFAIHSHETFVLVTTDRKPLDLDRFAELQNGSTLYLLRRKDQALQLAMEEHITFTPHYDTLIRSGLHEYYASEGQKPLPYALAELIDNALWATAKNTGTRTIELRMLFDESLGKPAIVVLDNGCGMTLKQLNNWAVFRHSKFTRANSTCESQKDGYVRPDPVPRSLNSDISYFGVGGKQAVFYIGDSTRMISKPVGSPDVHELVLSKEDFERKERNKEDIYSGVIRNRKPGDSSHVNKDNERFLHALIAEESGKESFTAVVITGIGPQHITFLKQDFEMWTRELAHTYHYYIHGLNGNDMKSSFSNSDQLPKIDIQVTLLEKHPRSPRVMNLREVDNDMQTLYINAAADKFEFKATTGLDTGTVEGVIRYHPFLYDKETYPEDPYAVQEPCNEDDDSDESGIRHQARGKRPIFECFWNGRLIPYTTVSEFDWCAWPGTTSKIPEECYSRFSGVLFTDDKFQVSTNKLTFMDLEQRVRSKETIFTRVVNGKEQRITHKNMFFSWLKNCHEKLDKQVKFLGFKEIVKRDDVTSKKMQHPWATFSSIEWDGNIYKTGQLVKSQKTIPILHGTVVQFLLYGDHDKDVFATGGQVEVCLEPKALYNKNKIIPISKINRIVKEEAIKINIERDLNKLPHKLKVDWPDGNPWPENGVRPAGTPLGALKVEILTKNGVSIWTIPTLVHATVNKLSVKLSIKKTGLGNDEEVVSFVAQHTTKWHFFFRKMETLTDPGSYTLLLETMITESGATTFGDENLPSYELKFTITAGSAEGFEMDGVSSTLHVGVPFDIPLHLKDCYGNAILSVPSLLPVLKCSDLDLSYETVDSSGSKFIIKGVKARGKVLNYQQSKTYDLKVTLPGLKKDTQTFKVSVLPGNPHSIHVMTEENPITVENGTPVRLNVEIHDEVGNVTAHPRQIVHCQVQGLPPVKIDCSSTGAGQLVTKPINLNIIGGEPQKLKVQFSQKCMALVVRELKVIPSTRVSLIKLFSRDDENLVLRNNEKIEWLAGGTLGKLFYKLYDEAGRAVPLTDEIASMIKVNWTSPVNLKDLLQGKLPDIQVPTQVLEDRFYQVSYQDQSVSVSFTIKPRPDEPARLKATLLQNTVNLGKTLSGTISEYDPDHTKVFFIYGLIQDNAQLFPYSDLELVDQHDNATKTLTSNCVNHMTVKAEGLDKSAVSFIWQESNRSVEVTGIRFLRGSPGIRELLFTCFSYMTAVIVKVTAGHPAQLKLVSGPKQPLQVKNDHSIPTPFIVQLSDKWGNPSPDKRVVVELTSSPPALKVMTAVISQPVDSEGKASFSVNSVCGPKGYYQLNFNGSFNNEPIPGPSVSLAVLPDPNKPVSLSVEYDSAARFPAGGTCPVFSVTVVSDEGSPMTTFNPAAVSMLLWEGVPSQNRPPPTATELRCSKPMENERRDCFHFTNKQIPERAGKYTIQFSLHIDETRSLLSNQITINVVANQPVKLGPDSQPPAPVVSCCMDIAHRTLVKNMTLTIMDSYGNPAGQDLGGKVVASIRSSSGDSNKPIPLFDGNIKRYPINLVQGKAHIASLSIKENSPGEDGSAYTLLFDAEVPMVPTPLAPFELTFHFYNDALNQQKMSELLEKKTELSAALAAHKGLFSGYSEFLEMLTVQYLSASDKVAELRGFLVRSNVNVAEPISIPDIDRLLKENTTEADRILRDPRRVCSIRDNFRGQQDVLGMVGHLAYVQDDAAARVISWHIRGDMDCVITRTTEAARRIYDNTQGRQQVMALDSMYVPPLNRGLPQMRNGRMLFEPPGNPVLARELLMSPQEGESCDIVFQNILKETILIDDLDSANNYRREVVQNKMPCPTILTRNGERVSAIGKFGGAQNKAPPIDTLTVFGAPLPQHYHSLIAQAELLCQCRTAVEKRDRAQKDRDDHLLTMNSLQTREKQQDMEKKEKRLEEIERQLMMKPMRPVKRGAEGAGEPLGIITKRAK
ncbi:structural maintenance of chromosomes flexible hinge domain-containing protein 1 isoform X1 [Scophthalmus maximus]|uniref:structural maintenance of chromosomes flexible hinge domain-containing protein 1 isoform X1 n=1 Tax=Scophthalmus maximus TaxID=52904 RepID=UPI001FA83945|nr:structural maintenance of chromosomes flexible hinge domain-containing protein 1 isoform X1 [Scophthalmus maximus]